MKAREILREAWRDVVSGAGNTALLALSFAALVGILATAEAQAINGAARSVEVWRTAGGAVTVVTGAHSINGAACEALRSTPGVTGAGALRDSGTDLSLPAMPIGAPRLVEVTPGLGQVLTSVGAMSGASGRALGTSGGALLSADAARTLGRASGSVLATAAAPVSVLGVLQWPDDGRRNAFGFSAIVAVPAAGVFDECWVALWPPNRALAEQLALSTRQDEVQQDAQLSVAPLNSAISADLDVRAGARTRVTRPAPLVATGFGLALGGAATALRRREVATALHLGVPRGALATQHLVESLAAVLLGYALCLPAVAWVVTGRIGSVSTVLGPVLASLGSGALGVLLGTTAVVVGMRERHLEHYLRGR